MPLTNLVTTSPIINHASYQEYLGEIGVLPTNKLERCFACGLPAVWLYMKAIGLEEVYFYILKRATTRAELFKELFYLLILTNGHNKFFPHIPEDFLNIQIPPDVAEAQVQIQEPAFQMAYSFSREQLIETLELIAKPNAMIRIGNQRRAISIMYSDNAYHVYHADNPRPLEFKSVDKCADLIIRTLNEQDDKEERVSAYIELRYIEGVKPEVNMELAKELQQKYIREDLTKSKPTRDLPKRPS